MNLGSALGGLVRSRAKRQGRLAFGVTVGLAGFRVFRRITRQSSKPAIRFAVKPGEVYEIRGVRRDR
jgi:hypothetical protein